MESGQISLREEPSSDVERVVQKLLKEAPSLKDLSPEQLDTIAKAVVLEDLKDDLKHRRDLAKVDLASLQETFLERQKSAHTRRAYESALIFLTTWAKRAGVHILEMMPRHADAFIASLEGSASSVRLKVAVASSFFAFLTRETENRVTNPFRGTRARPKRQTSAPLVPTDEDVKSLLTASEGSLHAAILCMVEHGFRIGALPTLETWGARFKASSKGKLLAGELSSETIEAIKSARLDPRHPWAGASPETIRDAFRYLARTLYRKGTIKAPYSVHDLRHYYAIKQYRQDHDIYRLKGLLGHSSLQVTETYLRGLESYL